MEMREDAYLFSFDELRVLLTALGYHECEGVFMPHKEFTAEDVLLVTYHLEKNGFLIAGEDAFRVPGDLERILRVIGEPEASFSIRGAGGRECYCYVVPGFVVVSEKVFEMRECVRIRGMSTEAYAAFREEIGDDDRDGGSADDGGSLRISI